MDFADYLSTNFQTIAKSPRPWKNTAESLKFAADLLHSKLIELDTRVQLNEKGDLLSEAWSVSSIFMMLAGLSLENLIKGILISQDPSIVNGGKFNWGRKPHGLVSLFKQANVLVSSDEKMFLKRLEEFVAWVGRYPLPLATTPLFNRQDRNVPIVGLPDDSNTFNNLYNRLITMF